MTALDLPPKLWLPAKPAIVRAASEEDIARAAKAARFDATFPQPTFVPAGKPKLTLNLLGTYYVSGSATTFTFPDCDLGPPRADRLIVMGVGCNTGASRNVASGTIGGAAATRYQGPSGYWDPAGLLGRVVPSGEAATITASFNGSVGHCVLHLFSLTGYASETPVASAGSHQAAGSSQSITFAFPAGGVGIFMHSHGNGNAPSWSGATPAYPGVAPVNVTSAYRWVTTAGSYTTTASWSGSAGRCTVGASWGPIV